MTAQLERAKRGMDGIYRRATVIITHEYYTRPVRFFSIFFALVVALGVLAFWQPIRAQLGQETLKNEQTRTAQLLQAKPTPKDAPLYSLTAKQETSPVIKLDQPAGVSFKRSDLKGLTFSADSAKSEHNAPVYRVIDAYGHPAEVKVAEDSSNTSNAETDTLVITPNSPTGAKPGRYTVEAYDPVTDKVISTQEFIWGVLAFNPDYAVYPVDTKADLAMAVLDDAGKTVCNAGVMLKITDPSGKDTLLGTGDGTVVVNDECWRYQFETNPDYQASFTPTIPGTYKVSMTATVNGAVRTMTDSFKVDPSSDIYIKRVGPTRTYPPVTYDYKLDVTAKQAGHYTVTDKVPSSFNVTHEGTGNTNFAVIDDGIQKTLSWEIDALANQNQTLSYSFLTPNLSPYLFQLGPSEVKSVDLDWMEPRTWLIASDVTCTSQSGGGNWSDTTKWSCGHAPGGSASDVAVVSNTNNMTLDADIATPTNLVSVTINASATLNGGTAKTLGIGGTAAAGTSFTLASGGIFTANTGTVRFVSNVALTMVSGAFTGSNKFNNVLLNLSSSTGRIYTEGAAIDVGGNFDFTPTGSGGTDDFKVNLSSGTTTITGTLTLDHGANATATIDTISGSNFGLSAGIINNVDGVLNIQNSTLTITGTSNTLFTNTGTFTVGGTSTTIFNGDGAPTALLSASTTFDNLTFSPSLASASRTYTLGAVPTLSTGSSLTVNPSGSAFTLTTVPTNATPAITVTATGTTTIQGSGSATGKLDMSVNNGGLNTGKINIAAGGNFTAGSGTHTLSATSSTLFTLNASGTFTSGTSTVVMNPNASVTTTSGTITGSNKFNILKLNPALSGGAKTYTFGTGAIETGSNFDIKPTAGAASQTLNVSLGAAITTAATGTLTIDAGTATNNPSVALDTINGSNWGITAGFIVLGGTGSGTKTLTARASIIELTGISGVLFTNNGTYTYGTSTIKVTSASGTPDLFTVGSTITIYKLIINAPSATYIYNEAYTTMDTASGNGIDIQGGVLAVTATIIGNSTGTFSMSASTSFYIFGDGILGGALFPSGFTAGNITLNASSEVRYTWNSFSCSTVSSVPTYGNLRVRTASSSCSFGMTGNTVAVGTVTIGDGAGTATLDTRPSSTDYNLTAGFINTATHGVLDADGSASIITLTGNTGTLFTKAGTFNAGTGFVKFVGDGDITATSNDAITFCNVVFNPTITADRIYTLGNQTLTLGSCTGAYFDLEPTAATAHTLTVKMGAAITSTNVDSVITIAGGGDGPATGKLDTNTANAITVGAISLGNNFPVGNLTAGSSTITLILTCVTECTGLSLLGAATFNAGTSTVIVNPNADSLIVSRGNFTGSNALYNLQLTPAMSNNRAYSFGYSFGDNQMEVTNNMDIKPTATAGSLTLSVYLNFGGLTVGNTLTIDAGTATNNPSVLLDTSYNNNSLTAGNLTINNTGTGTKTLNAQGSTVTISGNYTNNGTFTKGSSTVTANGTSTQTFSGTMTSPSDFNIFSITNSSGSVTGTCPTTSAFTAGVSFAASATFATYNIATTSLSAGVYVQYNSTSTYAVGTISWVGTGAKKIYFRNSNLTSGNWLLNYTPGTASISYVDVSSSNASGSGVAIPATTNNTDCGTGATANTNWDFGAAIVTISGNAYADEATTVWANCDHTTPKLNISLVVNGAAAQTTSCNSGTGAYSFSSVTVNTGQAVSVFFNTANGNTDKGIAVTVASSSAITLNPRKNIVWVKEESTTNISNTLMDHCDSVTPAGCANVPYHVTTGALTIDASTELHIETSKTFVPGGIVSTPKLHLQGAYTGGSETLTISGSGTGTARPLYIDGGTFTANTNTTTFTGAAASDIESVTYNNLQLYPASATETYTLMSGTLAVNGNLDVNNGGTLTVDVDTNDPAINLVGNLTLNITTTWTPSATAAFTFKPTGTKTWTDSTAGIQNLGLVTIGSGASTPKIQLATAVKMTTLNINGSHTLDANGSNTITLTGTSGTLFTRGGTFTQSTSNVTVTGAGATTLLSAATTFHIFTLNNSGNTVTAGAVITISSANSGNGITITSGKLNDGGNSIVGSGDAGSGTLSLASGTELCLGGNTACTDSSTTATTMPAFQTYTFNAASTVNYLSDAAQTIDGTPTYGNLKIIPTITTARIDVFETSTTPVINGDFTINPGTAANLLTVNMAGNITVAATKTTTITRTTSATSKLDSTASNYSLSTGLLDLETSGTLDIRNSTLTITGTSGTLFTRVGTFTVGGTSTTIFNGDGTATLTSNNTITFDNLQLTPALTTTNRTYTFGTSAMTINGNFDIKPTDTDAGASNSLTVSMGADITVAAGKTTTIDAGATNSPTAILDTRPSVTDYNLSTGFLVLGNGSGGNNTLDAGSSASVITLTGTSGTLFTKNSDGVFTQGTSEVDVTSASGTPRLLGGDVTFHKLVINSPATVINQGNFQLTINNVSGAALTISQGVLNAAAAGGSSVLTGPGSGNGTFTIASGATLCIGGNDANFNTSATCDGTTSTAARTFPSFQTYTFDAASTVRYLSDAAQTVSSTPAYGNLILIPKMSASRIYSLGGAMTINGNYSITPKASAGSTALTVNAAGNITLASGKNTTIQPDATNSPTAKLCLAQTTCSTGSSYNLTTNNLTIESAGTLDATGTTSAINIAGNYTNNGTFTAGSSTVTLNGSAAQTLTGGMLTTNAFYNLTITNASGVDASDNERTSYVAGVIFAAAATSTNNYVIITASVRITYNSGSTYTFNNINWNGQATGTRIFFRNSLTSATWLLKVTGTQTAVAYVNVSRSDASVAGGNTIIANLGDFDADNNVNWTFIITITVSGNAYADEATTAWVPCDDVTANISLVVNGGTASTTTCADVGGAYSFTNVTVAANNPISVFFNATDKGVATTVLTASPSGTVTLNPRKNIVWVTQETGVSSTTNANLDHCDSVSPAGCANVPYHVTTGALTVDASMELHVETSKTFVPGGNVTTPKMHVKGIYTGASETLTLNGSGATTARPLYIDSGTFTANTNTTIFTGTSASDIETTTYNNLQLYPASGTETYKLNTGTLAVNGNLDVNNGATSLTIDVDTNDPAINLAGNLTLNITTTWTASATAAFTFKPTGTKTWTDNVTAKQNMGLVTIGSGASTPKIQLGTAVKATNITIATSHELDTVSGSNFAIEVTGNWSNSGTFTAQLGTVTFSAVAAGKTLGGTMTGTTGKFYNLTFNGVSGGWTFNAAVEAAHDVNVTNGAVTASNNNLTVTNDMTLANTTGVVYTAGSSTIDVAHDFNDVGFKGVYGTSTLYMSGTGTLTGSSSNIQFYNIKMASNTKTTSIASPIRMTGVLTFDSGIANVTAGGAVMVYCAATCTPIVFNAPTTLSGTAGLYFRTNGGASYTETIAGANYGSWDIKPYAQITTVTYNLAGDVTTTGQFSLESASSGATFNTQNFNITSSVFYIGDETRTSSWAGINFGSSTISITNGAGALVFGVVSNGGTHTMDLGSAAISVKGDVYFANGTGAITITAGTSTLTYTNTGAKVYAPGGQSLYNLILNCSGATVTPNGAVIVTNDLTMTAGTLGGTQNVTVNGGDATGDGIINLTGGTFTLKGTGNFGGATAWTFSTLTFGASGTTSAATASGSGGITVSAVLNISGTTPTNTNTLLAGSKIWTLSGTGGTPFCGAVAPIFGTLTAQTSTFAYTGNNGAGNTKICGVWNYYKLTINGSEIYELQQATTVANDLTITTGTLDTVSGSNWGLIIGGNYSNSGTFTARAGDVTFNGTATQTLTGNMTAVSSSSFNSFTITNSSGSITSTCPTTSAFTAGVAFASSATFGSYNIATTGLAAGVYVQYNSTSTYTVTTISWVGTNAKKIYFRNSNLSSGTWLLVYSPGTASVSYVDVARSDASGGTAIPAGNGTNTDCGTNTNWTFDETLTLGLDSTSKTFGTILPGSNPSDQTSTLTATSNAVNGYVIYAWSTQAMTNVRFGGVTIPDWTGTNNVPTTFSAGSYGFGYTTDDSSLTGGTADRFTNGGAKFAGFTHTGPGDPVADRTAPSISAVNNITYRLYPSGSQADGDYTTVIVYVITAQFP